MLFQSAMQGRMDDRAIEETLERLLKNSGYDVDVKKKSEVGSEDVYAPHQGTFSAITRFWNKDTITLWNKDCSHISMLGAVAPDNLPPEIPVDFTPELLEFLFALHEAEHATQWGRERPGVRNDGNQAHTLNTKGLSQNNLMFLVC